MEVYDVPLGSQRSVQFDAKCLNAAERRLFLGSMLRLMVRRYGCGQPVLRRELLLLERLADDADGSRKERQ